MSSLSNLVSCVWIWLWATVHCECGAMNQDFSLVMEAFAHYGSMPWAEVFRRGSLGYSVKFFRQPSHGYEWGCPALPHRQPRHVCVRLSRYSWKLANLRVAQSSLLGHGLWVPRFIPEYLPFLPFCELKFSCRFGEAFLLIVEWPPVFENLESVQILRTSFLILITSSHCGFVLPSSSYALSRTWRGSVFQASLLRFFWLCVRDGLMLFFWTVSFY